MATKTNTSINGKKYYRLRKTVGHEVKNGKKVPVVKAFYGKSKLDAENKYKSYLLSISNSQSEAVIQSNKSFGELLDIFIDQVLKNDSKLEITTQESYEKKYRQLRRWNPQVLDKPINSLISLDIQQMYNDWDVAYSTIRGIHSVLRRFFDWAIMQQYCNDVLSPVVLPDKPHRKFKDGVEVYTDEELQLLIEGSKDERWHMVVLLGAYAGLRFGEIRGLEYSDIYDDIIHVRRQWTHGCEKKPKYNSKRDIPLHPRIKKALIEHEKWHKQEMVTRGYSTNHICTTRRGKPYDDGSLTRTVKARCNELGIPYKGTHVLRATFCTRLCKAGVPIQDASALMGHKSVDVTSRFYTFVDNDSKVNAINMLT